VPDGERDHFLIRVHVVALKHIQNCISLMLTAYEVTYVLYVQKKVTEEIDEILGMDAERRFTMKDLNSMKYLECCIKEALRLYPSVPVIARQINEDVNIGKFHTR
jgi:cytochrome P450 family 4